MASIEKLVKSFEALKLVQSSAGGEEPLLKKKETVLTKKEKIIHCSNIADVICTSSIRTYSEFPKLLGISVESFFFCCDDEDSDVRMVADECLNRTIKTLLDSHLGRLQAELYKEIKKNGQSRSLRVALGKFGDLCHLIKAQKCRQGHHYRHSFSLYIGLRFEIQCSRWAQTQMVIEHRGNLGMTLLQTPCVPLLWQLRCVRIGCPPTALLPIEWFFCPDMFYSWQLSILSNLKILPKCSMGQVKIGECTVCFPYSFVVLSADLLQDRSCTTQSEFGVMSLPGFVSTLGKLGGARADRRVGEETVFFPRRRPTIPPAHLLLASGRGGNNALLHSLERRSERKSIRRRPQNLTHCTGADRAGTSNSAFGNCFFNSQILNSQVSNFEGNVPASLGNAAIIREVPDFTGQAPMSRLTQFSVKVGLALSRHFTVNMLIAYIQILLSHKAVHMQNNVTVKKALYFYLAVYYLTFYNMLFTVDRMRTNITVLLHRLFLLLQNELFFVVLILVVPLTTLLISFNSLCKTSVSAIVPFLDGFLSLVCLSSYFFCARTINYVPQLADLVDKISGVVRSPSSVSCRTGLQATRLCVGSLLRSCHAHLVPALLEACMKLKDNTYWLVKVELAEMIGELSFRALQHLEAVSGCVWRSVCPRMATYQEVLVQGILLDLLGDEDIRVRTAVTASLSKCIPQLYYAEEQPGESAVSAEAAAESSLLLGWLLQDTWSSGPPRVHGLVAPFCCRAQGAAHAEAALSRLLHLLRRRLLTSSNKHLLHGVCQALSQLVVDYPVTVYSFAWTSALGSPVSSSLTLRSQASVSSSGLHEGSTGGGLLVHLVALLSPLALDLHVHQHLLTVAGHLLAGACFGCLQPQDIEAVASQDGEEPWASMRDRHLVPLLDRLFQHAMRLLNVFAHILEEQAVPTRGGLGLSGSPALSPIRRRSRGREDAPASTGNTAKATTGKPASEVASKTPVGLGHFASLPQYLKLYEVLKAAHSNYKVLLTFYRFKFHGAIKTWELATILPVTEADIARADCGQKRGNTLQTLMGEPCVPGTQLLKALFGTNLTSLWEGTSEALPAPLAPSTGLYHNCCSGPYAGLSKLLAGYSARSPLLTADATALGSWLSWMRRGCEKKISTLLKPGSKKGKAVLAAHIRLFEPVVLQALKQYTVSSSAHLQASVLDLLAQLVHLRVNYCLLDSDQIFIGFVIKQFEFIEEGQVLHAQVLIPQIFYFLVLLSYERYHSKPIISMPEIIQLCDRLMASGQPPDKYVIPALQAIVEDLFLLPSANRTDSRKELETQREVVVSVLLRLVQYPEASKLLLAVVHHSYQEGEDRWKKFSRQLIDVILPLMSQLQVRLDNRHALNVLQRLFDSVSPSVFRPVDILLKALLVSPTEPTVCFPAERWMCLVLASVRVLLAQTREEVVLSRLADLALPLRVPQALAPEALYDPLDLQSLGDNTEKAVARYLIQVVNVYGKHLCKILLQSPGAEAIFPFQQMSCLLLYLTHMFQSGSFRRVATAAMEAVHAESSAGTEVCGIEETNEHFLSLAYAYPTLTVQWCNILTLVNYGQQGFWSRLLWPTSQPLSPRRNRSTPAYSCSSELVSQAGLILLCDYLCENIYDAEPMTWLIVNHVSEIIHLSSEPPVSDFISVIHRNPAASGLFVQAVLTRCETRSSASFVGRLLGCLEGIHSAQCGALLALLVEKVLPTPHLCLARSCEALAQRQVELLLAQPSSSLQELARLPEFMRATRLHRRHPHLLALLEKLLKGDPTQQLASGEAVDAAGAPKWSVNKASLDLPDPPEWFLCQVRERCCSGQAWPMECSQLLANLGYEDAQAILQLKDVSPAIVCASLRLGAQRCGTAESALYRAARSSVLSRLRRLVARVPQLAAAECPRDLAALLADGPLWDAVGRLAPPTAAYLEGLTSLAADVPMDGLEDLAKFAVLCAEAIRWITDSPERFSCSQLEAFLRALDCVLSCPSLASLMGLPEHASWVCSVAAAVYHLVSQLKGWRSFPVALQEPPADSLAAGRAPVREACVQVAELVGWLEHAGREPHIPTFIRTMLHRVITGVARLPLVNGFARTPPVLWQMQWAPQWEAPVPPPPADWLLDRDLLHEYIYRANLLGWISRQQFEETWMALLGVLNTSPSSERETPEDEQERTAVQCLSVRCITSLLLQSLRLPQPGNPHSSSLLHQPRDKPFAFVHTRCGKRLQAVRTPVHEALLKMLKLKTNMAWGRSNIDKFCRYTDYSLGQVSVEYMCVAVGLAEDVASASSPLSSSSSSSSSQHSPPGGSAGCLRREAGLAAAGLDLRSCLHFLLDLYTQWLGPPDAIGQPLLTETIRSVVMLSDIFMESSQFDWMLSLFMDMYRHHPSEDEVLAQYLVLGIAKAAAVVGLDWDMQEKMRKFVDLGLHSPMPSTQLLSLHGLLYLLAQPGDAAAPLLPSATDYLARHLDDSTLKDSELGMLAVWALAFFLVENYPKKQDLTSRIVQASLGLCSGGEGIPQSLHLCILHGLERLLLADIVDSQDSQLVVKVCVDRVRHGKPGESLSALGVMLSALYIAQGVNKRRSQPSIEMEPANSEQRAAALERATLFFDRIKRGYPFEADLISQILPGFLGEFFPAQDILNKVIGEFLSNQQPHPQFLAAVLFKVCEGLHEGNHEELMHDWVLLSLSNFTQRSPLAMAIWSLSCCFVAVTATVWLRALFPLIRGRMGLLEEHDRELFYISALDFERQLARDQHRAQFHSVVRSVAHPDTPYAELLKRLPQPS
ncbi:unnamed protein product [Ixodes persulcatus]